jgi:hypothetical protein
MPLILLLIGITVCMATNLNLFRRIDRAPKIRKSQQLFFGLRLVRRYTVLEQFQHPAIQTKIVQHWRIFSSNKSAPANRKKGFCTNHDPNKQEVGFIFV